MRLDSDRHRRSGSGLRQFTKNAKAAGTSQSDAVLIGEADRKSVFGKLIDLRASITDPKIRLGVVQQRVE